MPESSNRYVPVIDHATQLSMGGEEPEITNIRGLTAERRAERVLDFINERINFLMQAPGNFPGRVNAIDVLTQYRDGLEELVTDASIESDGSPEQETRVQEVVIALEIGLDMLEEYIKKVEANEDNKEGEAE